MIIEGRADFDRFDGAGIEAFADVVEAAVGLQGGAGHDDRLFVVPEIFFNERANMERRTLDREVFAVLPGADPVDRVGVWRIGEVFQLRLDFFEIARGGFGAADEFFVIGDFIVRKARHPSREAVHRFAEDFEEGAAAHSRRPATAKNSHGCEFDRRFAPEPDSRIC